MTNTIDDQQILDWLNTGWLEVNSETIEVKFRGRKLKPTFVGKDNVNGTRYRIELRSLGKKRTIVRSKLVWMSVHRQVLQKDWEIHHKDEDRYNDRGDNLEAMHKDDHYELHNGPPNEDLGSNIMMSKDVFRTIAGLTVYRLAPSNTPIVRVDDLLNWIQQRGATCSEELEEGIIDYLEDL